MKGLLLATLLCVCAALFPPTAAGAAEFSPGSPGTGDPYYPCEPPLKTQETKRHKERRSAPPCNQPIFRGASFGRICLCVARHA